MQISIVAVIVIRIGDARLLRKIRNSNNPVVISVGGGRGCRGCGNANITRIWMSYTCGKRIHLRLPSFNLGQSSTDLRMHIHPSNSPTEHNFNKQGSHRRRVVSLTRVWDCDFHIGTPCRSDTSHSSFPPQCLILASPTSIPRRSRRDSRNERVLIFLRSADRTLCQPVFRGSLLFASARSPA